jgi:hypothetical protein
VPEAASDASIVGRACAHHSQNSLIAGGVAAEDSRGRRKIPIGRCTRSTSTADDERRDSSLLLSDLSVAFGSVA